MRFEQTIPILRIFDEALAREFYLDYLGLRPVFEHRFEPGMPLYMEVERDGLTLHLTEHHGDTSPAVRVFFWMTGIRAFHAELVAKHHPRQRPGLEHAFYGALCLALTDPFGNRLTFNERLPEPTPAPA
jgi:hypothetical protein